MSAYLKKRGRKYHFQKRIPTLLADRFSTDFVQLSLKTEDKATALQRAHNLNITLELLWAELAQSNPSLPLDNNMTELITFVRTCGFQYVPKDAIVRETPLYEFVNRINAADSFADSNAKIAVLGGFHATPNRFSVATEVYLEFEAGNLTHHSEQQLKKWKTPRIKASTNFIRIVGDKPVGEITRKDILEFRRWWINRINNEQLTANAANKEFTAVKQIIRNANNDHSLGLSINELFSEIRLREVEKITRFPFSDDFIKKVLLQLYKGGLNDEAALMVYAMIDTGARIKELVGLESEDVVLDGNVPHIKIRPNATRNLKTPQSKREIPLVGASLFAFQTLGGSFKRYQGKADLVSNTINKYFRDNNLLPSEHHSLYSLRHSFEDRLTAVGIPEKIQANLMGHKYSRPRYGLGPSLEQKRLWLNKIAFKIAK
ncbi:tyrosine-type recombinase/integrase [bacterium]|nr:tyrosine-type recombinase/integrase [bacterium]